MRLEEPDDLQIEHQVGLLKRLAVVFDCSAGQVAQVKSRAMAASWYLNRET